MSGWDVSSTPTWGPQDGPDDPPGFTGGTGAQDYDQDFGGQDFAGGYSGGGMAGGQPEFFGQDYEQQGQDLGSGGYPRRMPGQSFQDMPGQAPRGGAGGGYGQDWADNGGGQGGTWPPQGPGGPDDGGWGQAAGRPAAPWEERPQPGAGFGEAGGYGRQDYGRQDFGRQDYGRQDFGRQPEGFGYPGQDYPGQDYPGQDYQGRGRPPVDFGGQDREMAARNDPALQDFFSPTSGGVGFSDRGAGWSGGEPPRDGFRSGGDADWTGRPRGGVAMDQDLDWTGRPRGQRPPRNPRRGNDSDGGIGTKGLIVIAAVVVVIAAAGAYEFVHHKDSGTASASASASATATATGTAGTGGTMTGGGAATPAFSFVTPLPATAGGFPAGQDPSFVSSSTTTAQAILAKVTGGGAGTVKSTTPTVSGVYSLSGGQAVTVVGFTGTFTPAKVASILFKFGDDPNMYATGSHGGSLICTNTTTAPDAGVCIWASSSTLGVTEFYTSTGPQTMITAQSIAATDTVNIRANVEKKS